MRCERVRSSYEAGVIIPHRLAHSEMAQVLSLNVGQRGVIPLLASTGAAVPKQQLVALWMTTAVRRRLLGGNPGPTSGGRWLDHAW